MAVRAIVKGDNGYRLVFRAGLAWLVRPNGTVVCVSSWRPCCLVHLGMAAGTLGAISSADETARRAE